MFDFLLFSAIEKLSGCETGSFDVYSGLSKTNLTSKDVGNGYFVTYMSASWSKDVASAFMGTDGMILKIEKDFKDDRWINCCDVSWISKFTDEREIFFSRNVDYSFPFKLSIVDSYKGVQVVSMSKVPRYH